VPFGHYRMYAGEGKTIESGGGGVHMDSLANNPPAQIRTYLGKGGITRGLAIAGESGQEAVIPLTDERAMRKLRAGLGSGPTHLTANLYVDGEFMQVIAAEVVEDYRAGDVLASRGRRRGY
jgi:hypothetical protein